MRTGRVESELGAGLKACARVLLCISPWYALRTGQSFVFQLETADRKLRSSRGVRGEDPSLMLEEFQY